MSEINVDSTISLVNSFIPIIITLAVLGGLMTALGKIKF